jgi:hypothetical protein
VVDGSEWRRGQTVARGGRQWCGARGGGRWQHLGHFHDSLWWPALQAVQHGEDMVLGALMAARVDDEQCREAKATPLLGRTVVRVGENEDARKNGLGYDLDPWAVMDKDDSVHVGGGKVEHGAVRRQPTVGWRGVGRGRSVAGRGTRRTHCELTLTLGLGPLRWWPARTAKMGRAQLLFQLS